METQSIGKSSSPHHADSPDDSQCIQSSVGYAQTQPTANPCNPPHAQIFAANTQTER